MGYGGYTHFRSETVVFAPFRSFSEKLFLERFMLEPSLLENRIETRVSTSWIKEPAIEHVRIREIAALDRRIEHRDALVNLPVQAIQPGEEKPPFGI